MASMLLELKIENFGIIEAQRLRLAEGLNIISGESGSGKSLVMNALDVVLGARAAPGLVRNGAHRALVEAVFEVESPPEAANSLSNPIDSSDHYESQKTLTPIRGFRGNSQRQYLELRREITAEGRSRIYCNGELSTLNQVRALASRVIEIHGQHEHQRILDLDTHLEFLDLFAETQGLSKEVARLYQHFSHICSRLRNTGIEAEEREHRRDFLHFALDEIESFNPQEGEYEELSNEKALIQNSGRLFQDLCAAYSMMREEELAILPRLSSVIQLLEGHTELIPEAQEHLEQMQEASYVLEAAADFLREQKGRLQFSPERLEDINERLSGYQALHKKYGGSTKAVLSLKERYLRELGSIEMSSEQTEELEQNLVEVHAVLFKKAEELSRLRRAAVSKLEQKLAQELEHLGMPGAHIQISVKREVSLENEENASGQPIENEMRQELSASDTQLNSKLSQTLAQNKYLIHERGLDRVEFLLAANPGENPRPLRKIASGGELSRISLAFKNIFFDEQPVGTVVFDEVDAGVGGEVAHAIGKRLKELTKHSQVLVVTHLPQIARLADQHFHVFKKQIEGRSFSHINLLQEQERPHELARMLGGERLGAAALEHARQLLVSV